MTTEPFFELGRVVGTPGALDILDAATAELPSGTLGLQDGTACR